MATNGHNCAPSVGGPLGQRTFYQRVLNSPWALDPPVAGGHMLVRKEELRLFSIGEFSSASGIPVRTLRYYHEEGMLVPAAVDSATNYRSYDERNLEVARVILALRELEFSLDDIREILADCREDVDVLEHLDRQK